MSTDTELCQSLASNPLKGPHAARHAVFSRARLDVVGRDAHTNARATVVGAAATTDVTAAAAAAGSFRGDRENANPTRVGDLPKPLLRAPSASTHTPSSIGDTKGEKRAPPTSKESPTSGGDADGELRARASTSFGDADGELCALASE